MYKNINGLGKAIKRICGKKKLSIIELSELIRVPSETLYDICNGKVTYTDIKVLYKLASINDISFKEFLNYVDGLE